MEYSEEFLKGCSALNLKRALNIDLSLKCRATNLQRAFIWGESNKDNDFWWNEFLSLREGKELSYEASILLHDILEALEERKVK